MNENITDHSLVRVETPEALSRRRFLEKLSIALAGFCATVVGLPLIGFVVALQAQLGGLTNALGWLTVLIYGLFAVGFAYFLFGSRDRTRL